MKLNNRNKLLIAVSLLIVITVYKLTISKTLFYYNSYNSISKKKSDTEISKKELIFLHAKNKKLDVILERHGTLNMSDNYQNYLLKAITNLCENYNVSLVNFTEPETALLESRKFIHYEFMVEGNYNNALIFLNRLENKSYLGKIKHFSTKKKILLKENKVQIISNVVLEKTN